LRHLGRLIGRDVEIVIGEKGRKLR